MKKWLVAIALVLVTVPALAQTPANDVKWGVNLTYGFGRQYDIPGQNWTTFHIPGAELTFPDQQATIKVRMWFDSFTGDHARTDLYLTHRWQVGSRFAVDTQVGEILYQQPFLHPYYESDVLRRNDYQFYVEGRYALRLP